MASDKKNLSRRHILSMAGGTLGLLATGGVARTVANDAKALAATGAKTDDAALKTSKTPSPSQTSDVVTAKADATNRLQDASPEALQVLGAVTVGMQFGPWRVAKIHDFHRGAIPVVLESLEGGRYQIDVLLRDTRPGAVQGVADTRQLSLFLANQGSGRSSTNEHHGLGLMALAAAIRQKEPTTSSSKMLTLAGRQSRHPSASYDVLA